MRQSFSSASCAAGDSPCASSTTLQCVVANTPAPFSRLRSVGPIPLSEAPPSLADTVAIQAKNRPKIKIIGASENPGEAYSRPPVIAEVSRPTWLPLQLLYYT